MKTYECYEAVREFHRRNEQVISEEPTVEIPMVTKLLRIRLMAEECAELTIALHENDKVEIADALCDSLYVVYGTAVSCGIRMSDHWFLKPEPNNEPQSAGRIWLLFKKLADAIWPLTNDPGCSPDWAVQELSLQLNDLAAYLTLLGAFCGLPLRECFLEVHRSNLTKKLGGAGDGRKYGSGGGKATGYEPPRLREIIERIV